MKLILRTRCGCLRKIEWHNKKPPIEYSLPMKPRKELMHYKNIIGEIEERKFKIYKIHNNYVEYIEQ